MLYILGLFTFAAIWGLLVLHLMSLLAREAKRIYREEA